VSFYVHRINHETGREGWTGPIRSLAQAEKERASWESAEDSFGAGYSAEVHESSTDIKRAVREWTAARKAEGYRR